MSQYKALVTIGIPTWNRYNYLKFSLESALAQSYVNLEIIVSDNASSDQTRDYLGNIRDPRLIVIRQEKNIGGIANINACLDRASGQLFLLLGDDDAMDSSAIERLAAPFNNGVGNVASSEIGLSWCSCRVIDPDARLKWTTIPGPLLESPVDLLTAMFNGERGPRFSGVLTRTSDTRVAGGYNLDRYNAVCDTANWGAVCLLYPYVTCVGEPLISYRVHASSHTSVSVVSDWQLWGGRMHDDLVAIATSVYGPRETQRLKRSRKHLLANLTSDVLMRGVGKPGWILSSAQEIWRSREYMITPYVAKRLVRDGWKVLRG